MAARPENSSPPGEIRGGFFFEEIVGRPSDYSREITTAICVRLGLGESLREICRDDAMPDKSTVMRWLAAHQEFRDQYAGAREAQADYYAEEIIEIADDGSNDWMERQRQDGSTEEVENKEVLNRSRLRVDTRKWLMARMAPKKYGDKVTQEHTGPEGGPVQFQRIERVIIDPKPANADGEGVSSAS